MNFLEAWTPHLPALLIVIPLLGGILSPILGRGSKGWVWALLTMLCTAAVATKLFVRIRASGPISYPMGGWKIPYGIELHLDLLSAVIALVVAGVGLVVTIYARRSVEVEIPSDRLGFFWSLWLLAITGLLGIVVSGDAFNVYVLLEISSLTIYGLVAMGRSRDRRALSAALNYLILGSIGASFILIAIGLLYAATGTLNMADLKQQLASTTPDATIRSARAFLLAGLGLKMALFPLHLWMPAAYSRAPSAVAGLLAATATKVGIYMAMRFLYSVMATDDGVLTAPNVLLLSSCAGGAILFGSATAARQKNLSLLLAYSSVAQIGYIVLGMSVGQIDPTGTIMAGSILHIVFHALIKGGLFLCAGIFIWRLGGNQFDKLAGIGRRMPWTSAAVVAGGLGLIGVPGTAGFISKLYLLRGLFQSGHSALAILVLLGSVLAAIYTWRFVEVAYLRPAAKDAPQISEAPLGMLVPAWILIGASIWFGFESAPMVEIAFEAALGLLGGSG